MQRIKIGGKFRKRTYMFNKFTKVPMTIEEYAKAFFHGNKLEVWRNAKFQVIKTWMSSGMTVGENTLGMIWLSIKRMDQNPIHDWRELQEIKNLLVGDEYEGLEIYPAECKKVDGANQYHLWIFDDPTFRFPFGFQERLVEGPEVVLIDGVKQREFDYETKADE